MNQRLHTFLYIWCFLTAVLFLLGYYFTKVQRSRSYHVEDPDVQLGGEVTEFLPDTRKILYGENQQCRVKKKIIFAKTHKTGSTTLQNILFRFGQHHHLLFLLPKSGAHYFNLKSHFRRSMADLYRLYKNVRSDLSLVLILSIVTFLFSFDVFAAHGRWDGSEIKSLIPGAFTITILRSD